MTLLKKPGHIKEVYVDVKDGCGSGGGGGGGPERKVDVKPGLSE